MNVLLIITPFSPAQTPNTIRWNAIVNQFLKSGYKVTVLTTKWSGKPSIEDSNGISIYRVGDNTLLDFLYNKFGVRRRRNIEDKTVFKKQNVIISLIERFVDRLWRNRYWPDGSVLFLKPGKDKISGIIKDKSISHIISVGLPFTSHLIAKEAKIKYPKLHWTMDVQDPFSISDKFWVNNFSKYAIKNISEEEECLSLANKVVFTNSKVTEAYKELFFDQAEKYKVIPPIFVLPPQDKHHSKTNQSELRLDPDKIHLAYFGSFYEGVRSPFRFLKLLDYLFKHSKASLDMMQFHFYGEANKFSKPFFFLFNHLSPYIKHHGFLNHFNLHKHISKFDLLINFGNSTNYHLPSKVVEFLYYNKPVVNFTSIEDDSAKLFLKEKIEILNLNLEGNSEIEKSKTFITFVLKNRDISNVLLENVKEYLPLQIANEYLNLMTSD